MPNFSSLALVLVCCAATAYGQEITEPKTNNPFSRIGVGELAPHAYAAQIGMGGIGIGFHDSHIASPSNPAALGALRHTSFQVGVGLDRSQLEANGLENTNLTGNLDYLSLAFPLQNSLQRVLDGIDSKWRNGMLLALAPYSNIGYDIALSSEVDGIGAVRNQARGSGGYYRLQWGNGVAYDNKFRAGLNLSFIFGRTNAQRRVEALDVGNQELTILTDTDALRARGLEAQFGVQYDIDLPNTAAGGTRKLTLGGAYTLGATLRGESSEFATVLFPGDLTRRSLTDTISSRSDLSQEVNLPDEVGLGVYYSSAGRFKAGFDLTRVGWSNYSNTIQQEQRLRDVTRVAAGVEFVPDPKAFGQYWQQVRYRAGAYANGDPREGVDAETGLSFGLGLPIIRPREEVSYVNLAVNTGQFGSSEGISQRYIRLTVGFTLTDNSWFYKRRFN